ncbi:UDP-3-O-[3-hydroxymyristoyl] glucosamine N-acyltransferase [Roseateles sp. YR242]|uniref:UDP-3-O-(3-hydroxymyristoyl)glucosamine N-acyltransferase n=1 Tax=Roseateles sp. YR242 TaxID=1855305 RepID=UPI0008CD556C|nr:UDP-3-O-(3-hydroxymyristoyl)glucosamine N-acyltransferase [Roseateles sp. YR242]SEL22126.1 UDP-3-O-[3-hydroxymyristoyl] glucosamine N-acyltransferase [Roseateles sp. YR242]
MPKAPEVFESPPPEPGHRLSQLIARLGGTLQGEDRLIQRVAALEDARADEISFVAHARYTKRLDECRAGALIVKPEFIPAAEQADRSLIVTPDPYLYFALLQQMLHPPQPLCADRHPSAVIGENPTIGIGTEIGPMVCIGDRVRIGARCRLMAGVVIGDDVIIGDDVVLYPRVTIYAGCVLGHRVRIHSGAIIGADGFGMAWDGQRWQRIPHTGGVVLHDDVDIGANTTIDRGALADTVIESGVHIDNLVQIAHNVHIGAHTAIAACAGVAGSARIGARCRIGGAAVIVGHLEIAEGTIISPGSLVPNSLREPGRYTGLYPLLPHREWQTSAVYTRQLGRLVDRIREIECAFEVLAAGLAKPTARELEGGPTNGMPH